MQSRRTLAQRCGLARAVGDRSVSMVGGRSRSNWEYTYNLPLDAVEKQNLAHGQRGREPIEVQDAEWLEPSVAEEVINCPNLISKVDSFTDVSCDESADLDCPRGVQALVNVRSREAP
jgi:hypothetical protein